MFPLGILSMFANLMNSSSDDPAVLREENGSTDSSRGQPCFSQAICTIAKLFTSLKPTSFCSSLRKDSRDGARFRYLSRQMYLDVTCVFCSMNENRDDSYTRFMYGGQLSGRV